MRDASSESSDLRKQVIDTYLSYQDADVSVEKKRSMLHWARESKNAAKYADSIVQMPQRALELKARELVQTMRSEADRTGAPKQNQTENNPAYVIGDPLTSEAKQDEIINRQLGWEA